MEVKQLEGACLGGRCSATVTIAKAAAGVDVSGSLSVSGATIAALAGSGAGKPRASGTISGEFNFSGKGTSPRGVFSVLQGGGTLALGDAKLGTLWPGAIAKAVDAALKSDPDSLPATLKRTLADNLAGGELPLPARIGVEIADGRLAAKPFAIDAAGGRAQGAASLDLKTLLLESDWRLEQKPSAGPADKPALPGITVSYRGPVAALGSLEPRINLRRPRARACRAAHGARRGGAGTAASPRRGAPARGGGAPAPAAGAGAAAAARTRRPRAAAGHSGLTTGRGTRRRSQPCKFNVTY